MRAVQLIVERGSNPDPSGPDTTLVGTVQRATLGFSIQVVNVESGLFEPVFLIAFDGEVTVRGPILNWIGYRANSRRVNKASAARVFPWIRNRLRRQRCGFNPLFTTQGRAEADSKVVGTRVLFADMSEFIGETGQESTVHIRP